MNKNLLYTVSMFILLVITPLVLADTNTPTKEPIDVNIEQGKFYDVDDFTEYTANGEVPFKNCEEIDIKANEWFYYYSYSIDKAQNTVQFKLAYILDDGDKKKIIWINNPQVTVTDGDNKQTTKDLESFKFKSLEEAQKYIIAYNFKVDKSQCIANSNPVSDKDTIQIRPTIIVEEVKPVQTSDDSECPKENGLYNPCRDNQLLCMEHVCGARTLINEFINLRIPKSTGISYLDLYYRSLSQKTSGLALYNEALGYKKIAEIKKDYELKALSSQAEKIVKEEAKPDNSGAVVPAKTGNKKLMECSTLNTFLVNKDGITKFDSNSIPDIINMKYYNDKRLISGYDNTRTNFGFIVLHDGSQYGNQDPVNKVIVDWQARIKNGNPGSTHYYITCDGIIYPIIPEDKVAYHAGCSSSQNCKFSGINSVSIGIDLENCGTPAYNSGQYKSLKKLIGNLEDRGLISHESSDLNIIAHKEINQGKNDPVDSFDWDQLGLDSTKHTKVGSAFLSTLSSCNNK